MYLNRAGNWYVISDKPSPKLRRGRKTKSLGLLSDEPSKQFMEAHAEYSVHYRLPMYIGKDKAFKEYCRGLLEAYKLSKENERKRKRTSTSDRIVFNGTK